MSTIHRVSAIGTDIAKEGKMMRSLKLIAASGLLLMTAACGQQYGYGPSYGYNQGYGYPQNYGYYSSGYQQNYGYYQNQNQNYAPQGQTFVGRVANQGTYYRGW